MWSYFECAAQCMWGCAVSLLSVQTPSPVDLRALDAGGVEKCEQRIESFFQAPPFDVPARTTLNARSQILPEGVSRYTQDFIIATHPSTQSRYAFFQDLSQHLDNAVRIHTTPSTFGYTKMMIIANRADILDALCYENCVR